MRIGWFANGIPGTGGGRYYIELSNRLIETYSHEITFYLQDGVCDLWNLSKHLAEVRHIAQWRDNLRPEVAICGDPGRGHIVGYLFEGAEIAKKIWCMNFYSEEFKRWVSNSEFLKLAQTSWFARVASEVDSPDRVRIALGGVDTKFWSFNEGLREPLLLVYPKKSGYSAIEACIMAKERSKTYLQIARFGGEEAGWKESDFPDDTINVGAPAHEVEKLRNAYNRALIFVNSESNYGWGFSQCIAEAMSCGCAVVGGDSECFSDMLIDGVTGLTVPNNHAPELKNQTWLTRPNPEELAERILFLVNNAEYRKQLAYRARRHIEQFDYDLMAARFDEVIRE